MFKSGVRMCVYASAQTEMDPIILVTLITPHGNLGIVY